MRPGSQTRLCHGLRRRTGREGERRSFSERVVGAPWRAFVQAALWKGKAPQTTTGAARVRDSHCQLSNCRAGTIALASLPSPDGVCVLVSGDEEVGSATSRELIEEAARGCRAAFVLEASADEDGALKTARKGTSRYEVVVRGRAAHAGLEPQKGVSIRASGSQADRRSRTWPTVISGSCGSNTRSSR